MQLLLQILDGIIAKPPAKSPEFPYWLNLKPKQKVPKNSTAAIQGTGLDDLNEIAACEWLSTDSCRITPDFVQEQTLYQEQGYAITLIWTEEDDAD